MAEENQLGDDRQNRGRGGKLRINVPPPTKLDISGNLEVALRKFKRSWTNYEVATGLVDETSECRTAVLLTTIGDDAADIFDGFVFENGHEKNIDSVLKKFEDFCVDEANEVYESYKFHNRNQQPGETIDAYVAVLRRLAKGCNFGPLEGRMVRDRVVAGIASDVVRKKLLQEKILDLPKCMEIGRVHEVSTAQAKDMAGADVTADIHKVQHKTQMQKSGDKKGAARGGAARTQKKCSFCGGSHDRGKDKCPAYGKKCNNCQRQNHFAKVCKMKQKVNRVTDCASDDESDEDILLVDADMNHDKVFAKMMVEGMIISFQLDSGATINTLLGTAVW